MSAADAGDLPWAVFSPFTPFLRSPGLPPVGPGMRPRTGPIGVIRDLGYSSTSIDRGVASEFAAGKPGATVLEIEAPRGTPAAFVPADGGLKEAEVLLPRGTRYEVISVRERDGVKIARVRIVR